LNRGILGRGLVLSADAVATEVVYRGMRYERRFVTLDVEVVGQPPYQTRLNLRIPRIVEALPGATLDLRVNPSDAEDIEIIGPAGACDWLTEAAAVPGQTWGPTTFVIPDADAGMTPFGSSAYDDSDAATVRAIQGGGAGAMGCVVLIVVGLSLGVIWLVFVALH
jgi:hypothetical protein